MCFAHNTERSWCLLASVVVLCDRIVGARKYSRLWRIPACHPIGPYSWLFPIALIHLPGDPPGIAACWQNECHSCGVMLK